MSKIILATTNSSKINPFRFAWDRIGLNSKYNLLTFNDIDPKPNFEVLENTGSFEKDALKKAIEYSKFLNLPTISIDRGIEIPSLNNWPGTKSKDVFYGYSYETKHLISNKRAQKDNLIAITQYILNKIAEPKRIVNSVYGIAIALPDGRHSSDLVIHPGKASKKLVISDVGWNYDWFFIPKGLNKTLSSLEYADYISFTGKYLWPITKKIFSFINENITYNEY